MDVRHGNHAVYTINYHFVWCPKYRHAVLDLIEAPLERSIRGVSERYGYEILSLHIAPDHVHLFLSAHPKHAPSEIVRTIKSVTAREMWEQHEPLLEQMFWGGGFWERSFYVGTAGEMSGRTVERYINRTEHV
ncbi:IS200/IS605 family transposase [Natronococcus sp. JC468]|uniref:IS200/IS605 family transposase n=1 Tax=Natronococcus sp. JC468 TaxID=1961921 RepID=UPI00143C87A9|nr:IS200/IS605 family transposase [Natronococcus sp. JC468]NKE38036.1 IS200/IS605 family transposase [Natronococcus sp. JC468]